MGRRRTLKRKIRDRVNSSPIPYGLWKSIYDMFRLSCLASESCPDNGPKELYERILSDKELRILFRAEVSLLESLSTMYGIYGAAYEFAKRHGSNAEAVIFRIARLLVEVYDRRIKALEEIAEKHEMGTKERFLLESLIKEHEARKEALLDLKRLANDDITIDGILEKVEKECKKI